MISYSIDHVTHANAGVAREWAVCRHYNIERTAHDNVPYDKGSDLDVANKHISIKSSGFTLMSGALCEGLTEFTEIWTLYKQRVHSNVFAYVTLEYQVFEMNIDEFEKFVFAFGRVEHDSNKNGGQAKIRLRKESAKMVRWLEEMSMEAGQRSRLFSRKRSSPVVRPGGVHAIYTKPNRFFCADCLLFL